MDRKTSDIKILSREDKVFGNKVNRVGTRISQNKQLPAVSIR